MMMSLGFIMEAKGISDGFSYDFIICEFIKLIENRFFWFCVSKIF